MVVFLFVCAVFWFAWWLRDHINKGRIEALEERLRLAKKNQQALAREISRLNSIPYSRLGVGDYMWFFGLLTQALVDRTRQDTEARDQF